VGENEKRDLQNDGDGGETSAADEPTAIWDMEALRAAGLDAVLRESEPEPRPRTPSTAPVAAEPSMMVDDAVLAETETAADHAGTDEASRDTPSSLPAHAPNAPSDPAAPAAMRVGLESVPSRRYGWGAALGAGAAFFGAVYALIRYFM
jgi:hypothetical protein